MSRRSWRDKLGQAGLLLLVEASLVLTAKSVLAQSEIVPDATLGSKSSQVRTDEVKGLPAEVIEGGAQRGANLFHSFSEFNVNEGRGAYFTNPNGIENILGRVTGANPSQILGTLGVRGDANLFLINPNGMIFGQNARLDVNGSFIGSTADSLLFPDGREFSASDPQTEPLLTINVPIGLGLGDNAGVIVNRSFVQNSAGDFVGLEVPPGKNLTLVGGDIRFEAGEVTATGGRIELGGLRQAGEVTLSSDGSLNFPSDVARADITLSNAAGIDVTGTGGGNIVINGRNLRLEGGELGSSTIRAGITADSTDSQAQAGNITINATNNVTIDDESIIGNQVDSEAVGDGGNVIITTDSLSLTNGGVVNAATFGQGNAGSVEIVASDTITIDGEDSDGISSSAGSFVAEGGVGNGGDVTITTGSLSLTNGGFASAVTFGRGNTGSVSITASDTITIDGETSDGFRSNVATQITPKVVGEGGDITITTGSLSLTNGGNITAATFGQGNAGSVAIVVSDTITIDGESSNSNSSSVGSQVAEGGVGQGGDVTITTGSLSLTNGGFVVATTVGQGNAGSVAIVASDTITIDGESSDGFSSGAVSQVAEGAEGKGGKVTITTDSLSLTNGGFVSAATFGQGDAGSVAIVASDTITIDGENSKGIFSSANSLVTEGAKGKGGDVTITTDSLSLTNGGFVSAATVGQGDAGSVAIVASDTITIDGESSDVIPSSVGSQVAEGAKGKGGDVTITTDSLSLTNGGFVSAATVGQGDAGSVAIVASDTITIDGETSDGFSSGVSSLVNPGAKGKGGDVTITTDSLSLTNGGFIGAATVGQGDAGVIEINASELTLQNRGILSVSGQGDFNPGDLTITADNISLSDRSTIEASTESGDRGNITLNTRLLALDNNSQITTNATGTATGGNITINAPDGFIVAVPEGDSDITANATAASGGQVTINAQSLFGIEAREQETPKSDITASSDLGVDFNGDVTINTSELDPESGLNELPTIPIDADAIIAQNFCNLKDNRIAGGSSFTIVGRGGLPPTADDPIINRTRIVDWAKPAEESSSPSRQQPEINSHSHNSVAEEDTQPAIQQAQGWAKTKDGKIVLTADAPIIVPQTGQTAFPNCSVN